MRREESVRVPRVERERLLVVHLGQIAEHEVELNPVREDLAVPAVGNELLKMISFTPESKTY